MLILEKIGIFQSGLSERTRLRYEFIGGRLEYRTAFGVFQNIEVFSRHGRWERVQMSLEFNWVLSFQLFSMRELSWDFLI